MTRRMTTLALAAIPAILALSALGGLAKDIEKAKSVLDFKVKDIDGKDVDLAKYKGDVLLIVNTASKCGLTPQYEGLEVALREVQGPGLRGPRLPRQRVRQAGAGHQRGDQGRSARPSTTSRFPVFSKIVVKGDGIHPLYQFLTSKETDPNHAGEIPWNFTKFLVNRKGEVIARFDPKVTPDSAEVTKAIEAALAESK